MRIQYLLVGGRDWTAVPRCQTTASGRDGYCGGKQTGLVVSSQFTFAR